MTELPVRPEAVAGTFYPSEPGALRALVEGLLRDAAASTPPLGPPPKALVVPHAAFSYSGAVAATAYARALPLRGRVERVVLLGPAHRGPLRAVAVPGAGAFATPLGPVPVDTSACEDLVGAGLAVVCDEAHAHEHSIEVQLPFLQVALGGVTVVPLAVGQVPTSSVADVVQRVWGGAETLTVVSTDLSHYHDRSTASRLDRRTAAAVVAKAAEELGPDDACGVFALRGLVEAARRAGLDVELLDVRTSADAGGSPDRVVGYAAFALA